MIGRNAIPIILATGVGLLASAGAIYLYSRGDLPRFETKQEGPASPTISPQPKPSTPATAALRESQPQPAPKPKTEAPGAASPAEPTVVPTFDVVVIDPSGEGVIAGRAAPGWQVSVQSGETKVAVATADDQGEWSAVLEKPLAAGDHALSLTITSPMGRAHSPRNSACASGGTDEKKDRHLPQWARSAPAASDGTQSDADAPALAQPGPLAGTSAVAAEQGYRARLAGTEESKARRPPTPYSGLWTMRRPGRAQAP
jgi:hypothetical protein